MHKTSGREHLLTRNIMSKDSEVRGLGILRRLQKHILTIEEGVEIILICSSVHMIQCSKNEYVGQRRK